MNFERELIHKNVFLASRCNSELKNKSRRRARSEHTLKQINPLSPATKIAGLLNKNNFIKPSDKLTTSFRHLSLAYQTLSPSSTRSAQRLVSRFPSNERHSGLRFDLQSRNSPSAFATNQRRMTSNVESLRLIKITYQNTYTHFSDVWTIA